MSPTRVTIDLSHLPARCNPAFYPLFFDKSPEIWLRGGASAGKSVFCAQKMVIRCATETAARHRLLCLRKVAATLRHSCFQQCRDVIAELGWQKLFKVYRSPGDLRIECLNGNELLFAGLDDVEKLKSYVGITSEWIEEATQLTKDDHDQLRLRMRGKTPHYKQQLMSFNPIRSTHWIKREIWDDPRDGIVLHASTYKDNNFLEQSDRDGIELLATKNPSLYKVYGLGEWGTLKGRIYQPYTVLSQSDWPSRDKFSDTFYGLDFGFNNPTALIQVDMYDAAPYLSEIVYARELTTDDLIERMEKRKVRKDVPIYCDAAEPDRIEQIRRAGYTARPAEKGQGSVSAGISFVQGLPDMYCRAQDENLIAENEAYCWQVDRDGEPMDKPIDFMNHAMDAKRYALWSHIGKRRGMNLSGITREALGI